MSQLKIKIQRSDFFSLISQAYSLIEKRSVMPILSKILMDAKGNSLCVQATDQDNSLQTKVSAKVEKAGQVVVDAQSLYDILKELPEGEVNLTEQSGQKLRLTQGHSIFNLLSLNVQDFPAFPPFQMKNSFLIKSSVLKHLIEKTAYCASVDETRYHLTGVFFEVAKPIIAKETQKGDMLCFRFVATDGHRLGLAEYPCEKALLKKGVIISKKGVQEIKKMISYSFSEEDVEVALSPPRVLFRYGDAILSVKLVEGSYPNYKPLIPKSSFVSVVLDTEVFSQTLKRVSLLSSNRFKGVNFQIKKDKVLMEAENPELGSAQDEVPSYKKTGGDLKVRFNARYVLDALNSFETKQVGVEFGGKEAPCIIRPVLNIKEKNRQQQSLCVVMPMKM